MRVENKTYYYFENQEKRMFEKFLCEHHITMTGFAADCHMSLPMLSLIINGKRSMTTKTLELFKKKGFEIKL